MIADVTKVVMMDGSTRAAIDLFPGGEVMAIVHEKPRPAPVVEKVIENQNDVVCLILSNGQRLIGSRDQKIKVCREHRTWYTPFADIEVGMTLQGKVNGLTTIVRVVGVMYNAKRQVRMVGLRFDKDACFIVEGVLCRS